MTILSRVIENEEMQNIRKEFNRLGDKCYLDNAGAVLYPASLIKKVNCDLLNNIYMNPHSDKYSKDCVEQIRHLVLKYFNTDAANYSVVFTSGATQSLKLVTESFEFENDGDDLHCGSFIYLQDNHTSVVGLRELAKKKNVDVIHISHDDFLRSLEPTYQCKKDTKDRDTHKGNTLLVYPAQTNFNGFKYPINCMNNIKNGCLKGYLKKQLCVVDCNWYVLLDAASFVSTSRLDLSSTQPDFVCLSFYKMFGYPTGLGALLIKNSSIDVLSQKSYFGGGTVDIVLSSEDFHVKREELHERFEDGTIPFLSVIALKHCFDVLFNLIPKTVNNNLIDTISYHTYYLAKDLYEQLQNLQHQNGTKATVLYMDSDFSDIKKQGSVVTFNIIRDDGSYIGYAEFQHMAELFNISVRTGCFCNSGSCQRHLNVNNREMKEIYKAGHKCGDEMDLVHGRPTGAIRASFGYHNTFEDVDKLIIMICRCFVRTQASQPKRTLINFKSSTSIPNTTFLNEHISLKTINNRIAIRDVTNKNESKIVLSEIAIFPIKSCGAFKMESWKIGHKGFEFDREWMIVKDNGVCLTQKQNTSMCMIRPVIDFNQKCLTLSFKGKPSISVPLQPLQAYKYKQSSLCQSKVCTDSVKGYDCGDEVADWISEALGISYLRLIRQSDDYKRIKKNKKSSENQTILSLSNQAQFLLINNATVRWLKNKIQDSFFTDSMTSLTDRFRGNLVIEMAQELVEREWQSIVIGGHEFKVEDQCSRCQMVCIDQTTGEKTVEPLRTISEQFAGKLRFGIYLSYIGPIHGSNDSVLRINSQVKPVYNADNII